MLIIFRGCIMMNRKGFISTAALYSFFLVFCMLLILIMTTYTNNRVNYKSVKIDAKETAYKDFKAKNRYVDLPSSVINPDSFFGFEKILIDNSNGKNNVIDAQNYIKGKGEPDFSILAKTNEGIFAAQDDLGTSYYFRGSVNNNWLKFGKDNLNNDIYWRVIRVNGDNSIRMIYSGTTPPTSSTATVMTGTGTQINALTYNFNSSYNRAEYVGYMYTLGQQHGNNTSSTIKKIIDDWYKTTTLETDTKTKKIVVDQIFCNDRSASSTQTAAWTSTGTQYYYGAYGRLEVNKKPILTCPLASDKFTVSASNGNGALKYPVGLITADEIAMAGSIHDRNHPNNSFYLYTSNTYWSGTPYNFYSSGYSTMLFAWAPGNLYNGNTNNVTGIRPVISLSSMIKLSGDGTYNNPYEVTE